MKINEKLEKALLLVSYRINFSAIQTSFTCQMKYKENKRKKRETALVIASSHISSPNSSNFKHLSNFTPFPTSDHLIIMKNKENTREKQQH